MDYSSPYTRGAVNTVYNVKRSMLIMHYEIHAGLDIAINTVVFATSFLFFATRKTMSNCKFATS